MTSLDILRTFASMTEANRVQKERENARRWTYQGRTQLLTDWAKELGISYITLKKRIDQGLSDEEIAKKPTYNNEKISAFGRLQSTKKWSEETGIDETTLRQRLSSGMDPEEALTLPVQSKVLSLTYAGRTQTADEWAEELGLSPYTLRSRLYQGWPIDKVLSPPISQPGKWTDLLVTVDGETHTLSQWANKLGMKFQTLFVRISRSKMSPEDAVRAGKHLHAKFYTYAGKTQSLDDWAEEYGINSDTLRSRLDRGDSIDKALLTPVQVKTRKGPALSKVKRELGRAGAGTPINTNAQVRMHDPKQDYISPEEALRKWVENQ